VTRRNLGILAAAIVGLIAVGVGMPFNESKLTRTAAAATDPHTLVIGVRDDPSAAGFDPDFGGGSDVQNELMKNTGGQWVQYARKPTGKGYDVTDPTRFTPDLLQSWKMAPNHLSVNMTLRPDLRDHSGKRLTTQDLMCWLQRAFKGNGGSAWDFQTGGVPKLSDITVTGTNAFTIRFPKPAPLFFPLMRDQSVSLLSCDWKKHATKKDPFAKLYLAQHDLRPGEYKVISKVPGSQIVLGWDSSYPGPKPYFTTIILKSIPSSTDRALLLRQGAIDIAESLGGDDLQLLTKAPGVHVWSIPARQQLVLGMMNNRKPFNDVRVRRAVSYAIPYSDILEGVYDKRGAISTTGPVPRQSVWKTGIRWPYAYNLEKAKTLLSQAGLSKGFTFTIGVDAGKAQEEATAVLIQSSLAKLGINATIAKDPDAVYNDKKFKGKYDAWLDDGWNAFVDNPYYYLFIFYRSGIYCCNFMHYKNPTVDRINDTLAHTIATPAIKQMWTQAVAQITKDAPVAFILDLNWQVAARSDIRGIVSEPDSLLSYRDLRRG
jgi:peptide/nickel transport system substrate-binding protein